jgi:hypothetical protein
MNAGVDVFPAVVGLLTNSTCFGHCYAQQQELLSFFQSRKNGKQNGTPQYISTNFLIFSKVENNISVVWV